MTSAASTSRFGDLLRDLRKAKGVYLGDLAGRIHVAPSYLSDVELGRRHPFKAEAIERIAAALPLSAAEVDALLTAASVERGGFELPVNRQNQAAVEAGAALVRAWPTLSDDAYREIQRLVERLTSSPLSRSPAHTPR